MLTLDYRTADGIELGRAVASGSVSARELMDAAIVRTRETNRCLNAMNIEAFEHGREAARTIDRLRAQGVDLPCFAGVPLLLKDLNAPCRGIELTQSSRFRKGYVPNYDSAVVERLKAAGFAIFGRSNSAEYGSGLVTEPALWGPTRNPWDPTLTPGGSSGGAAAAVASGMIPIGHCNDAGGSARLPASYCGLFGVKPSRGRTPNGPELGELWRGMVVEGMMTRSVRDAAAFLDHIAGPDVGAVHYAPAPKRSYLDEVSAPAGKLRIAFTTKPPLSVPIDPQIRATVERAALAAVQLGHEVAEDAPMFEPTQLYGNFLKFGMVAAAFTFQLDSWRVGRPPEPDDHEIGTRLAAKMGKSIGADDYEMANFWLRRESRRIAAFFERYDAWLTPVSLVMPATIGAGRIGDDERRRMEKLLDGDGKIDAAKVEDMIHARYRNSAFLPLANITGHPAVSIPFGRSTSGLPIGVHVMGRFGEEGALFRLARQIEKEFPWGNSWPRIAEAAP
jgi:amidase